MADLIARAMAKSGSLSSTLVKEAAALGAELMDATGWTSTDWTGDFATGFTHVTGNTTSLIKAMTGTGTNRYIVSFDVGVALDDTDLVIKLGNSLSSGLYKGPGTHYDVGIKSASDGNLEFIPGSTWTGTITNISVKQVTGIFAPSFVIVDAAGDNALEIRNTDEDLKNVWIGANCGQYNVAGYDNVGLGADALAGNISGFWNMGIGTEALNANTMGSRNVAIGYQALKANTIGKRNIAIGSYSSKNTIDGYGNVAIGADTLFQQTSGHENIAIGHASLYTCSSGYKNIAIGVSVLGKLTTAYNNIAIGNGVLYNLTEGLRNVGIGAGALGAVVTASKNTAIGEQTLKLATGSDNTAIGYTAGDNVTTGSFNICIGSGADVDVATNSYQLNIGNLIKGNMTAGSLNVELLGGLKLAAIPTADPHVAGQVWANGGVLTVSAG